ncbi:MAG: glycosyltransferase family 2 protein [Lachnospiraceae bacterium]|nr:glycosyltransferase family 2 protein [Lachnospiraceae bacterium]
MLSDFDLEGMSKPEKLVYYIKNYGMSYATKKMMKKLGFAPDPDSEYMAWCRRNSEPKSVKKAQIEELNEKGALKKYCVLLSDADNSTHAKRSTALASVNDASYGYVKVVEAVDEKQALENIDGEYVVLMEDDAVLLDDFFIELEKALKEMPDADIIYSDEDSVNKNRRFRPYFKPDRSPMLLLNFQYMGSVWVIKRTLLNDILKDESVRLLWNHWYALALEAFKRTDKICHVKRCLFSNLRTDSGFVRSTSESQLMCLKEYVSRHNIAAEVTSSDVPGFYHLKYKLEKKPLVSIIIPNMDHIDDLKKCIDSIFEVSTYENVEIIIAENNSKEQETFDYYNEIVLANKKVKVVYWKEEFNYSAINDYACEVARGDLFLFLNNDTQIINPEAIEELVAGAMQPGFGASGALLFYGDDTIQHAGVIIGMGGFAAHALWSLTDRDEKYYPFSVTSREMGGVTGACLMMRREAFEKVGGFDRDFRVALNDIDLCMKVRGAGYEILFTPYARLYHYESKSRGYEDTMEKQARFQTEIDRFQTKWKKELEAGDEYYNVNLTLHRADYSMDIE